MGFDFGFDSNNNIQASEQECFITLEPLSKLENPVWCPLGHLFEKTQIVDWLNKNPTCPVDCKPLKSSQLTSTDPKAKKIDEAAKAKLPPPLPPRPPLHPRPALPQESVLNELPPAARAQNMMQGQMPRNSQGIVNMQGAVAQSLVNNPLFQKRQALQSSRRT